LKRIKAKIEQGHLVIGRERLRKEIRSLDGIYEIKITKWKDDRSIRQNNLYWQWVGIIANELGYHKRELHEALLEKFAPIVTIRDIDGKPRQKILRTSMMNTKQMYEYMNDTNIFTTQELNINLPQPPEDW